MATNNSANYSPVKNNILIGDDNGTIANVAPPVNGALISNGTALPPSFGTVNILSGGTGSTAYNQANGILTWNGTQFTNYSSGPQIDASKRYTNPSQPLCYAYLAANDLNVTGDGTLYTLGATAGNSLTELYDVGSNFNTTTATYTAPVTGYYFINAQAKLAGILNTHTSGNMLLTMTSYTYRSNTLNPFNVWNASQGLLAITIAYVAKMTAGDTLQFQVNVFNGTKVIDISSANYDSFISVGLLS
jgi:hypothetical protein